MLQSSVSGLQRLFSSASSSISPHKLESCIEEAHTYDLLFPGGIRHGDPAQISAAASSADERGGLDIGPRGVRIVIAQDATGLSPARKTVLYDSHPPSVPVSQAWNGSPSEATLRRQRAGSLGGLTGGGFRSNDSQKPRTAPHSRQSSLSQTAQSGTTTLVSPLSPVNELGGLFLNPEGYTPSGRPATRDGETEALLDCMFGFDTGLAATSGTKLHIRPPKSTPNIQENRPGSAARDPVSPVAFPKRRTPLTRSTTASELQTESTEEIRPTPRPDSCAIWITRLFSVDFRDSALATSRPDESLLEQVRSCGLNSPEPGSIRPQSTQKEKANQVKTPMYGIAMVLQMPSHRQRPPTPFSHRSCGYSTSSTQSWSLDGRSGSNIPGLEPHGDVEYVMAHRSVIDRALSELEIVALSKIGDALSKVEFPNPGLPEKESIRRSDSGSSIAVRTPKQQTQQKLELPVGALLGTPLIQDMADRTGKRIALALKIRKVITGQGRWDAWRHELRWVDRRASGREHNFFFFNLLTAYLASHTDWLQVLAPSQERRRYAKTAKEGPKDNITQHRTVIVSSDKMGSRRWVFLLSAFLLGSQSKLVSNAPVHFNWPNLGFSESPRSSGQIGRQHTLGKTPSRRTRGNPAYEKTNLRGSSISSSDSESRSSAKFPIKHQNTHRSSRRASNTRSNGIVALLTTSDGSATRKSSTTTTATITAESAVPIAHFASHLNDPLLDGAEGSRPSSSESLAPVALQRALSRSESNEHSTASTDSPPGSVWGSMSTLWGGRRGSSSDPLASSEEGLGISGLPRIMGRHRMSPTLNQMVGEVEKAKVQRNAKKYNSQGTAGQPLVHSSQDLDSASLKISPRKYMHGMLEPFPLKLSVDEHDGIIDVDLPQATSPTASSPIAVHTAASSLNDRSSLYSRVPSPIPAYPDSGTAGYVAGWLRSYHPDLDLQAVRPYDGLKDQIIGSMRTTPPPTSGADGSVDKWSEVCSTLIADCSKYTITRLSLRRKNATSSHHRARALLESPTRDISHEEQIVEEPLMDMDPTLIDAVEKVISHSGESSRVASRAPSPTRRRHYNFTEGSPRLEIPHSECGKTVLGALEQVARSVRAEMAAHDRSKAVWGACKSDDLHEESILRQGVHKWFRELDSHAA